MIVSWQENLPEDEIPPEWMWPLDYELEQWFENVKRKREDKYGRSDDDDRDEVPMMSNQLAARKRR